MTVTLLALGILACFVWAVIGNTAAADWAERAKRAERRAQRAEEFAEECLQVQEGLTVLLTSFRQANDRLYACLRDRMDEDEYAGLFSNPAAGRIADQDAANEAARADLESLGWLDDSTWGER